MGINKIGQSPKVRRRLNVIIVESKDTKKKYWHYKEEKNMKKTEPSNTQSCVESTLDEIEILYSETTTITKGRKGFAEVRLINSTTTWQMTSHREWFQQYEPISGGSVYMGNDHALEIFGIGSIKVKMDDDVIHTILEV